MSNSRRLERRWGLFLMIVTSKVLRRDSRRRRDKVAGEFARARATRRYIIYCGRTSFYCRFTSLPRGGQRRVLPATPPVILILKPSQWGCSLYREVAEIQDRLGK